MRIFVLLHYKEYGFQNETCSTIYYNIDIDNFKLDFKLEKNEKIILEIWEDGKCYLVDDYYEFIGRQEN